jgi:hypothetical protein
MTRKASKDPKRRRMALIHRTPMETDGDADILMH